MKGAALIALLLLAGDVEEEHAEVKARLEAEKKAFDSLGGERQSLLTLLDTLERLSRDAQERSAKLSRLARRIDQRLAASRAEEATLDAAITEQERALAPRLVSLYRLSRTDKTGAFLSAGDFAGAVKRQRGLTALVAQDAAALERLSTLKQWRQTEARRLTRLEASARRIVGALKGEQAVAEARKTRLVELASWVGAERNRMSRFIAELEASEKELATLVSDLKSGRPTSGFRARKGQLPWPAKGLVEVGFGRVVNPRFNTVTVQKGIDLRAASGAAVHAVGEGTVVFKGWLKGYGTIVIVDHGSLYHSLYAHLSRVDVEVGMPVAEGADLGAVGDTGSLKGSYLYFEIRKQGQAIDPLPWLKPEE